MKHLHNASIYNNGKRLDLEIEEYKTLFKVYVIDETKWFYNIGTLRVKKHKGVNHVNVVEIIRDMCINNKWF